MKFQVTRHIRLPKLMSEKKIHNFKTQVDRWWPTQKLRKISISFYSLPQNRQNSANNRFQAKLVKYSNFHDIFADVSPILRKFCMMTHISYPEHNSCSKIQF